MSETVTLWNAYQQVPLDQRICPACEKPIEKNLAIHDGVLFHWGCLKNDERFGETRALCVSCGSYLTNSKIVRASYDPSGAEVKSCGLCGSMNISTFNANRSESAPNDG